MKEIYKEETFAIYEDINNYYLRILQGKKIEFGKHAFPTDLFPKLSLNYLNYICAKISPGGEWISSTLSIDKGNILFSKLNFEVYSLHQIIVLKKI